MLAVAFISSAIQLNEYTNQGKTKNKARDDKKNKSVTIGIFSTKEERNGHA